MNHSMTPKKRKAKRMIICSACKYENSIRNRDGNIYCRKCGQLLGHKLGSMIQIFRKHGEISYLIKHHRMPDGRLLSRTDKPYEKKNEVN